MAKLAGVARAQGSLSHPRDRRTRQVEKRQRRIERLDSQKNKRRAEQDELFVRFYWFREQCLALQKVSDDNSDIAARPARLSERQVLALTHLYIERNKAELGALRAMRNPPRGRIRQLEALREAEMDALHSRRGLVVPSLLRADDVAILTQIWDGLAETMAVVPRRSVTATEPDTNMCALQADVEAKLKPVDAVREHTLAHLPPRAQRRLRRAGMVLSRPDAQAAAAGGRKAALQAKATSVKKRDDSDLAVRLRSRQAGRQRQQAQLAQHRHDALATRRGIHNT